MDPVSTIGLVESSLGLALQFGSAAKALNDVAGKYKTAKLAIKALAQNLDILELAWTQIGEWFQGYAEESLHDDGLTKRVEGFLETGNLVMEALQHDLQAYNIDHLGFSQRSKLVWNETSLQGHQSRMRDQAISMSLFLQAVNLPTPQARAKLLQKSETQFQKSHESAYSIDSIVPSQMSVSTSQRESYASTQSQVTIQYRRLSFEKRLFMSKVYMRSSKNVMIKELSKARTGLKRMTAATAMDQNSTDWEAIRDQLEADSLLETSCDVSIDINETIRFRKHPESSPRSSREYDATNMSNPSYNNGLIRACEQGDRLRVEWLLARGIDLHAHFKEAKYYGLKGIHVAAMYGRINVVEKLLGYGAIIEEEEASERWRPLHFAAKNGQGAMAKFLIQHGAQIDAKARYGIEPIHEASWSGSIEVLEILFEAGAAIDCSDGLGCQPLHWATMAPNQPDVIKYLSRKGADIEAKAFDGCRPLRLACTSDPTNLGALIRLGAKMDYYDGSESALETAIKRDSKWALETLLKHGADPNRQNRDGKTVLYTLARIGYSTPRETSNAVQTFQLLLESGADVDLMDKLGNQVLHCLAVLRPKLIADMVAIDQLAKLVLEQGANINALNKDGLSPLYLAMQGRNRQLSRLLVTSGASILRRSNSLRAEVQVSTLDDSQTSRYKMITWRCHNDPRVWHQWRWGFSDLSLDLSIDENGFFTESAMSAVCKAF